MSALIQKTCERTATIAVVGRSGQLARAIAARGPEFAFEIATLGRPQLDLLQADHVCAVLAECQPDLIVNAAAYTAVDQAESEPTLAMRINGDGAGAVARAAHALSVPVIHISTDYVFDGCSALPYREDDPTCPLGSYGWSKLEGERQVRAATTEHVILRTAWVYSAVGTNFVRTMLRLAVSCDEVRVVGDQVGCPTSALDLAEGILKIARMLVSHPEPRYYGTFHMTGAGTATWADVAEHVFAISAQLGGPVARVRKIATFEYPTRARRPPNSRLDGTHLATTYGISLRHWAPAVKETVVQLINAGWPETNSTES